MRRADRLFQVIQLLRRRNVATAAWLAQELEVSERTIYRDVRDLVLSGVPIEGEAGVGYLLRRGFDLPPLMFTDSEIEAMVLGARVVQSWGDAGLAKAAGDALASVESVLPERLQARLNGTPLFAPGFHVRTHVAEALTTLRGAIERGARCTSSTRAWRMQRPSATSARSGCSSGDRRGRWPRGASCDRRSATSGSTACAR